MFIMDLGILAGLGILARRQQHDGDFFGRTDICREKANLHTSEYTLITKFSSVQTQSDD